MNFIGLTKEAEDYLHGAGLVVSSTYAVELPDGTVCHLRRFRPHTERIPITCSVGGAVVEVLQEYVCGNVCTCLANDPGWYGYSLDGGILPPGRFTRVHTKYDAQLKTYKLTAPVLLDNAMFKWKREPRGALHPMWTLSSMTGTLPNAWFPPDTTQKEEVS